MSDRKTVPKLGQARLTEAEKQAIAEMVESDGFKVWKKKIVPSREVVIGGMLTNAAQTIEDLWYYKGMSFENGKPIKMLEDTAAKYNATQLDEDAED